MTDDKQGATKFLQIWLYKRRIFHKTWQQVPGEVSYRSEQGKICIVAFQKKMGWATGEARYRPLDFVWIHK